MSKSHCIYWDSCIFYGFLKAEEHYDGCQAALQYYAQQVDEGEIILMTSVIALTEVLSAKISPEAAMQFRDFFKRRNVRLIEVNTRLALLAREIRDYYQKNSQKGFTVGTPDAIHLASAILWKADEFHTFDKNDKPKFQELGLLGLNGKIAEKYSLHIQRPLPPLQSNLPLK